MPSWFHRYMYRDNPVIKDLRNIKVATHREHFTHDKRSCGARATQPHAMWNQAPSPLNPGLPYVTTYRSCATRGLESESDSLTALEITEPQGCKLESGTSDL